MEPKARPICSCIQALRRWSPKLDQYALRLILQATKSLMGTFGTRLRLNKCSLCHNCCSHLHNFVTENWGGYPGNKARFFTHWCHYLTHTHTHTHTYTQHTYSHTHTQHTQPEPIPVLQLSPAPGERDYFFHLDEAEGISDLYDLHKPPVSAAK